MKKSWLSLLVLLLVLLVLAPPTVQAGDKEDAIAKMREVVLSSKLRANKFNAYNVAVDKNYKLLRIQRERLLPGFTAKLLTKEQVKVFQATDKMIMVLIRQGTAIIINAVSMDKGQAHTYFYAGITNAYVDVPKDWASALGNFEGALAYYEYYDIGIDASRDKQIDAEVELIILKILLDFLLLI